MKDHLAQSVSWHYVINLPGQAYPLRTPEEMVDILRIYNGANDIEGIYRRRLTNRYTQVCCSVFVSFNVCGDTTDEINCLASGVHSSVMWLAFLPQCFLVL